MALVEAFCGRHDRVLAHTQAKRMLGFCSSVVFGRSEQLIVLFIYSGWLDEVLCERRPNLSATCRPQSVPDTHAVVSVASKLKV